MFAGFSGLSQGGEGAHDYTIEVTGVRRGYHGRGIATLRKQGLPILHALRSLFEGSIVVPALC